MEGGAIPAANEPAPQAGAAGEGEPKTRAVESAVESAAPDEKRTAPANLAANPAPLTAGMVANVTAMAERKGVPVARILDRFGVSDLREIGFGKINEALAWIASGGQ